MAVRSKGKDALLVAAIDFGTSYSGYAFQFYDEYMKDPTMISSPQAWNSGKQSLISLKTPTCLLLNDKKELDKCAFGFEAENRYAHLCIDKKNDKYYFFRNFKMRLQEGEGLKISSLLEDETGKKMLALDVFAMSIKCLKSHLMNELQKRGTGVEESDIFWVLTVPAIWNDDAKQFMREAAIKTGIDCNKLEIVLEPEAASILCQHISLDCLGVKRAQVQFAAAPVGTKYMVVDLGGGTADITVHEKLEGGKLKEIIKATGGPWGGTAVDSAFFQLLVSIVGGPVMNRFVKEETYDYLDLCRDFEGAKRSFSRSDENKMIIKLPAVLNELCEKIIGSSFKKCLAESVHGKDITLRADKMILEAYLVEVLFRKATDHIVDHIKTILETNSGQDISLILMVGGFAESQFVQEVICQAFHDKTGVQFIIPKEAGITIVKGAVLFGRMPETIDSRILRFTYGVRKCTDFIEGTHPEVKKTLTDDGVKCTDIFDIIISANSEVKYGFEVKKSYHTVEYNKATLPFQIYYTMEKSPTFTTEQGCKFLGSCMVDIPNPSKGKRWVDVTFWFGLTEMKFTAVERETKTPCSTSFIFLE